VDGDLGGSEDISAINVFKNSFCSGGLN